MFSSREILILSLTIRSVYTLPTVSASPSSAAVSVSSEPLPVATGPTCVQTRSPDDPLASDIDAAIQDDNTISKACDVSTQRTTTINDGSLSVIYYGLDGSYFFNITHNANTVSQPVVSPDLCPDTFKDIFSTCVMSQNSWGGWVMSGGTNRSITNYIYPGNVISHEVSSSSTILSSVQSLSPNTIASTVSSGTFHGTYYTGSSSNVVSTGGSLPTGTSHNTGQAQSTGQLLSASGSQAIAGGTTATDPINTSSGLDLSTTSGPLPSTNPSGTHQTGGQQLTSSSPPSAQTSVVNGGSTNAQVSSITNAQPPTTQLYAISTVNQPESSQHTAQPSGTVPETTGLPISGTSLLHSSIPFPSGGTVVFATISGRPFSETFVPTTYLTYASLASTITTSTLDSHSSAMPVVIGPGGVAWVPLNKPSGTAPELLAPTVPPTAPNVPHQTSITTGQSDLSKSLSGGPGTSQTLFNPTAIPSQTPAPGTTQNGDGTTGAPLITITTSYDPEASTVTSVGPEVTGNTVIHTSDDHHGLGFYPFWKGGPHCFIICPPGIDNGGIILWGMDKPGIYPPPTPPPFPSIEWPTITINDDLEPTATEEPEDEPTKPTNSEPEKSATRTTPKSTAQSTARTTSKPSSSSIRSSTQSSTHSGTYSEAVQNYVLAIPTVGTDELKQRNTWLVKFYHISGASGLTDSGSIGATATGASTTQGSAISSMTRGPSTAPSTMSRPTATATSPPTSTAAQTSRSINPADCPNDGVRQNAPYCPTPSSSTGFSCGLASNVGVATYAPATWCACRNPDESYSTMPGDNPCAYTTPPATPISPHAVTPAPTGVPPLSDCSLVITTETGTIAPGPQTYCTCGPVMASINTQTSDGMVYSICAGDPFPTIASSSLPPAKTTEPPKPKASEAIIIYREDSCGDLDCSSFGHVFEISPGEPVNPCDDDDVFGDSYTQSVANDDSDYPVHFGPFKAHDIDGLRYSGSNNHVGTLTGNVPGSPIQCIVPAAQATSCTDSHSIQADDMIPIVYCEW